jgi:limonene-1,2-epoxide hydrolase
MAQPQEYAKIVRDLSSSDWASEPAYILAVIGLLNARNAVETEVVDHAKLNRARVKSGKPELFEHKILKIAHRQRQRVFTDGVDTRDYAPMRGHFVRGHFKVRKTGIYFWHPFARGDFGRGKIEKDYELT